ncbi:MAG: M24 family metallopeptidase [Hyphomicrobiales bacterium]
MSQTSIETARATLRALPERLGLDAVVAMSPENFAYVSGVHIITVNLVRPRQGYAVLPASGEPELVICSIEKPLAETEGWIKTIHPYVEFIDDPIDALTKRLRELGLARGRIGIDLDYLPANSYERLKQNLGNVHLVDTSAEIAAIRAVKHAREIELIQHAARGTHRATLDAMRDSKLGDTEQEMCRRIANGIMASGATAITFLCFSSGERTRISHAMPTERVPKESEIIRFDVGGAYGSYSSDFARTYSTGKPSPLQRQTYAALLHIQKTTIEAVRPGIVAEDLFHLCRDEYRKAGLPFTMPHIGHSFGIELHESPMLRPGEKTKLQAGMVFNIEPSTADTEGSKYHIEDLLEVTATGYRLMTLGWSPPEIPVIGQA